MIENSEQILKQHQKSELSQSEKYISEVDLRKIIAEFEKLPENRDY